MSSDPFIMYYFPKFRFLYSKGFCIAKPLEQFTDEELLQYAIEHDKELEKAIKEEKKRGES